MARRAVIPNAENCTLVELEVAAKAAPTQRSAMRLMAIRAILLSIPSEQVSALFSVDDRTLLSWIHRFNLQGIDGLIERPRSGRPRKIKPEQVVSYKALVQNPNSVGETHWTAKKFHGYLRDELSEEIGYSTVVRWLHEQGFALKVPRSWPDRQDEAKRAAFLEQLKVYLADPEIDLWYLDETGIEGDPRPRRQWAKVGEKTRLPYQGTHLRMNVAGMVLPRKGDFYALEFTHVDTEVFQVFLDHANQDLTLERPRNLLICDNATWHKAKKLNWGNFEPVLLPPYSPDFNPIERLWLLIKSEWFNGYFAKNYDELVSRIDNALIWAINRKQHNQKTCAIPK